MDYHRPLIYVNTREDIGLRPKAYPGDAGYDLACAGLRAGLSEWTYAIPTGCHIELPPMMWAEVCARSSTQDRHKVEVIRGVIDNGYRGELAVIVRPLRGFSGIDYGSRIAQLILHPILEVPLARLESVQQLTHSDRGPRGFGSSGA